MEYFDFNATTPVCDEALNTWVSIARDFSGNPSSLHRVGRRADHQMETARLKLADLIDCHQEDIIWTSGATESNNMVFNHLRHSSPPDAQVWLSAVEHPCVRKAAHFHFGDNVRTIEVTPDGAVDVAALEDSLKKADSLPVLISVMAANNETGALQDWVAINKLCQTYNIQFHCDAAQWLGKLPAHGLGMCSFVSGASHKFSGPKGVGFLKVPGSIEWTSMILGGGQEESRRAGTENVAGIAAMVCALELRNAAVSPEFIQIRQNWKNDIFDRLQSAVPGVKVVGDLDRSLWNTLMVIMPEIDCRQRWVVKLDKAGYAVSAGSACSSGKEKQSHVLAAMGLNPDESSRAVRLSAGWDTSLEEWENLVTTMHRVADEMRLACKDD